ncbi:MAG: amidohydrolase [Clostridiales bacterium]|nr:amidohydrolase [Clostridiales bacterium]
MQPSVLFKKITVVTPSDDHSVVVIPDAYVSVSNGQILYVGNNVFEAKRAFENKSDTPDKEYYYASEEFDGPSDFEEYSGTNAILLPTFANGHSHLPMTLFKNTADDMRLEDWLFKEILPREKKLDRSDIYYASLLGIAEMINGGTGASADMYFMSDETARAALDSGFRLNLCHDGKLFENDEWKPDYPGLEAFRKEFHTAGSGLLRVSLMVHSVYLYPEFLYPILAEEAESADVSIQVHLSETKTEVQNCYAKYNLSPAEALSKFGIFDRPCIAAHGVHLNENDLTILNSHNVTVAHNPSSNLKLASGVCDVNSLRQSGVNVCIGTDGSASNNNLDMYMEMRIASLIAKERFDDPRIMSAKETLSMATRNGYSAMGFTDCGIIKAGMQADLQVVRCDNPSVWPIGDPISALVYGTPSSSVESVMIAGQFVKYKGEFTTIDFEKVMAETMSSAKRLLID